jgi:hypothetical protein
MASRGRGDPIRFIEIGNRAVDFAPAAEGHRALEINVGEFVPAKSAGLDQGRASRHRFCHRPFEVETNLLLGPVVDEIRRNKSENAARERDSGQSKQCQPS